MSEHTPTPWTHESVGRFVGADDSLVGVTVQDDPQANANAEYIVRCVNVHEELVAALEYVATYDTEAHIRERAQAALQKARGSAS